MVTVSVVYPATERFDHDHYGTVHVPLVGRHWTEHGLNGVTVLKGLPGPDGAPAPYALIALLDFADGESLQAAMAAPGTAEIMADIANFTDAPPTIQVNERVG
ncbi:EthD family reductase [Sphingomonas ginkgonis]|uniref:EthD family reductase n=1 Tax=Sphingomonas ginkgonis TaxID=2315330 RepID=A0A3S0ELE5_9SPHN|nr:EthD family reductase [Sphingomonas ginkgonis]RST30286.1 EthD family reductase [Sphingomonas ginkgonis]